MATRTHNTVHWFKKGLRLHDNPSLLEAVKTSKELRPVYILDPALVEKGNIGFNRWRFLLQSLKDLDEKLRSFNSRLYVIQGAPKDAFPELFDKWKITQLTFEVETEPLAVEMNDEVCQLATAAGVKVIQKVSHSLYDLDRILEENSGSPPLVYKRLLTIVGKLGHPEKPLPSMTLDDFKDCCCSDDDDDSKSVPSLGDLNIATPEESKEAVFPGGESEALDRLEKSLKNEGWVNSFEKPNTSPNSLTPSTTVLSPYLMFGCLSPRLFYHRLLEIHAKAKKHSQPPVSLHGQLLWREFFFCNAYKVPNFNKMKDNPICLQVDWDTNPEFFKAWSEGRTGYPFIDAIMTQLRQEGWIHHLARHAVACFLTRGDLWISWEEGMKVFEKYLLDADWSLNAGNWLWLSASAFFHAYFRVYSPVAFGKKTDKSGDYIRKYIPALKKYPVNYIYEPWKAPLSVQKGAGCIIGKDYPRPIVDHDVVRKRNIDRMAKARKSKAATNDEEDDDESSTGKKRSSKTSSGSPKKKGKFAQSTLDKLLV